MSGHLMGHIVGRKRGFFIVAQPQFQRGKCLFNVARLAGSDNRGRDYRVGQYPRQSNSRHGGSAVVGHFPQGGDDRLVNIAAKTPLAGIFVRAGPGGLATLAL